MVRSEIRQAIELVLSATFSEKKDGSECQFFFGRPEGPRGLRSLGAETFHTRVGMLKAALHIRKVGQAHIKDIPIGELESRLLGILKEQYWLLADEVWGRTFKESYAERVSSDVKDRLALALSVSKLFTPQIAPTLYPLVPIQVEADFVSEPFFLVHPPSLTSELLQCSVPLIPEQFPPIRSWKYRKEKPSSWLGVRSPEVASSKRMRNVILGAIALLPHPKERYMRSGRIMFGGRITIDDSWTLTFEDACTPPLSEYIVINEGDRSWLSILASKLINTGSTSLGQMKALEYYYRAWSLNPAERFPTLFMALDALFSERGKANQSIVEGARDIMGP